MRRIVSILILAALAGCREPLSPVDSIERERPWNAGVLAGEPRLILAVKAQSRAIETGGVIVVTVSVTNPGSEPIVVVGGAGCLTKLAMDKSKRQRVFESCLGIGPITLGARQTGSVAIEILAGHPDPVSGAIVPYDPGLYRLSLSMPGRSEKSPPFVFRLLPQLP